MLTDIHILINVALAMILSSLLGIEREIADKPAGFRTHMLVGGASALLVGTSDLIVREFDISSSLVQVDPIRAIEAIIAGVSFLGAGTIFRRDESNQMEGLTTAASLLFVTGIGISVSSSHYLLAIGATILALLVLTLAKRIQPLLTKLFRAEEH